MIKVFNKDSEKIGIETDMPLSLANAIRRSASYIPLLAIDSLEITKNDSALYDEVLAHRLGLIPLKNEKLKLGDECGCGKEEGCGKCSIKLKLNASGPCIVYSDQLSPGESIVYKMPITILDKGQEIEFVAVARMGIGKEHAKYAPGLMYYHYSGDIKKEDDESFKKLIDEARKKGNNNLNLFIESWGQISPKDILIESIEVLNAEIKEFLKKLK